MVLVLSSCKNKEESSAIPDASESQENNQNGESDSSQTDTKSVVQKTLESYEISEKEPGTYKVKLEEFNLGDKEYSAQSGKVMPYKLRGIMGVPEGEGKFPLVLITHGSHSNLDENLRFDTGFTYLVEKLAENGYIAVSMDMSKPYIWKYGDSDDNEKSIHLTDEHIQKLKAANEGSEVGFPINLKDKIDFDQIALIGHSRGGETIFDIALEEEKKDVSVKALLAIAPTLPADAETKEWPDAAVSIIVPEYDGDVVNLDGFSIQTMLDETSSQTHAVTFLNKANHNYFNTNIKENDATLAREEETLKDQISPEQQQQFLVDYTIDFLGFALNNKIEGTMYDMNTPQSDKMYGLGVMNRLTRQEDNIVTDVTDVGKFMTEGAIIESTVDSWFFQNDNTLTDTLTFGQEKYMTKPLLNIQWQSKTDKLTFVPLSQDFSNYQALTINMVVDPSNSLNEEGKSQTFSVALKDTEGNTTSVTLPQNQNSLRYISGKIDVTPLEDEEIKYWTTPTPISNTRIPLSLFEKVDLSKIDSVSVNFDQTNSGSVYLESILLQ